MENFFFLFSQLWISIWRIGTESAAHFVDDPAGGTMLFQAICCPRNQQMRQMGISHNRQNDGKTD